MAFEQPGKVSAVVSEDFRSRITGLLIKAGFPNIGEQREEQLLEF